VAAATLVVATACSDPQSPKPTAQILPANTGTLVVAASTKGSDIDPDGYTVWIDVLRSEGIGPNGLATFSGLAAGDHTAALYQIASNCGVFTFPDGGPNNPRTTSVMEGVGGTEDFTVNCEPVGSLLVSTNTTGVDLDADGYTIRVDGESHFIAANGRVTLTGLASGDHSVSLSGVGGNCTASGSTQRTVTVTAGRTAAATFSLSCAPTGSGRGRLIVMTRTTGSSLDPDGYTVTVDGSVDSVATRTDTVTFIGPAGAHPVALSGVAPNCAVSGANPRTVSVPADGTGTTTFSVTCGVPQANMIGKGQLGTGSPEPGAWRQNFDFDVRADLTGRFSVIAYDHTRADGSVTTITTDPSKDAATSFTAYRNSSAVCSDPSGGAEFDAVGRYDEGDLVKYTVIACDDGPEGSDMDLFSVFVPAEGQGRSGTLSSGDIVKK
jgi:hypothetical protein